MFGIPKPKEIVPEQYLKQNQKVDPEKLKKQINVRKLKK